MADDVTEPLDVDDTPEGQLIQMKMAKASRDDIERLTTFFLMLEEALEYGTYTPPNQETEFERIDDERILELIREAWGQYGPGVGPSWRRVVMGCGILIDNCCDPEADTLEWRKDVAAFLETQEQAAGDQTGCPGHEAADGE